MKPPTPRSLSSVEPAQIVWVAPPATRCGVAPRAGGVPAGRAVEGKTHGQRRYSRLTSPPQSIKYVDGVKVASREWENRKRDLTDVYDAGQGGLRAGDHQPGEHPCLKRGVEQGSRQGAGETAKS